VEEALIDKMRNRYRFKQYRPQRGLSTFRHSTTDRDPVVDSNRDFDMPEALHNFGKFSFHVGHFCGIVRGWKETRGA
jgi:hypothetical protein